MKRQLLAGLLWLSCMVSLFCSQPPTPPPAERAAPPRQPPSAGSVAEKDSALKTIVPADAKIEKLADGFVFTEGPVWVKESGGALLFSDIPNNRIMKWTPDGKVSEFRKPSGYTGPPAPEGAFVGSNGLTLDKEGRLIICEHGNRRVTRLDKDGKVTVLADKYQGKRLNSPNDAVYKSDGSLYFTDPQYGLFDEKKKELDFQGIYRLSADGRLQLLNKELSRPNGLAFSPDEKTLYVANSDPEKKLWMAYDVAGSGTLSNGRVFSDVMAEKEEGLPDGLKVDTQGNVYCTGPGGVWIFSSDGKHLGTIKPAEVPANCHWGDADGKTLYMTARKGLYRIRLNAAGIRP
jgi:gluconolactonase